MSRTFRRPSPPEGAALEIALEELRRGLVPAPNAEIAFDEDGGGVRDVLVVDREARFARGVRFRQLGRGKDLGVSISGWSDCPTPEAAWRTLMLYGFASRAEAIRALVQFARIRECTWARRAVFEDDVCAIFEPGAQAAEERVGRVLERRQLIDIGEGLDFAEAETRLLELAER